MKKIKKIIKELVPKIEAGLINDKQTVAELKDVLFLIEKKEQSIGGFVQIVIGVSWLVAVLIILGII